jgi:hypothetical protein
MSLFALPSSATPIDVDLNSVTGTLVGGYEAVVPGLGSISLVYGSPTTSYDGYNAGSPYFNGGDNFVLGAGNSITISAIGFDLASAIFEIWDLDTVSVTESVTFNPAGLTLTGVNYNIANSSAHTTDRQFSTAITPDSNSEITIVAGSAGAAFAIGGIVVTAIPTPATFALVGLGLIGLRASRTRNAC